MILPGRMSAQVPFNMLITGCMMTFYKSTPAVVFWQWFNQSFNALVNYTNRAGDVDIPVSTLGTSYVAATGGALATALGLNATVKTLPPLVGRLVPFMAVAAGNSINIPLMRRMELADGIMLESAEGEKIGESKIAARQGISMVILSRIGMATPGMVMIPIVMNKLEGQGFFKKYPRAPAPLQIGLLGLVLTFATPMCCAIFEQRPPSNRQPLSLTSRRRSSRCRTRQSCFTTTRDCRLSSAQASRGFVLAFSSQFSELKYSHFFCSRHPAQIP